MSTVARAACRSLLVATLVLAPLTARASEAGLAVEMDLGLYLPLIVGTAALATGALAVGSHNAITWTQGKRASGTLFATGCIIGGASIGTGVSLLAVDGGAGDPAQVGLGVTGAVLGVLTLGAALLARAAPRRPPRDIDIWRRSPAAVSGPTLVVLPVAGADIRGAPTAGLGVRVTF